MRDIRPDFSNWLNLSVNQILGVVGEISKIQYWCCSIDSDTETCIKGAEHTLERLDEARERLQNTITSAKKLANT